MTTTTDTDTMIRLYGTPEAAVQALRRQRAIMLAEMPDGPEKRASKRAVEDLILALTIPGCISAAGQMTMDFGDNGDLFA